MDTNRHEFFLGSCSFISRLSMTDNLKIINDHDFNLAIALEPEGDVFTLPPGEILYVYYRGKAPTLVINGHQSTQLTRNENVIAVWPADECEYRFRDQDPRTFHELMNRSR